MLRTQEKKSDSNGLSCSACSSKLPLLFLSILAMCVLCGASNGSVESLKSFYRESSTDIIGMQEEPHTCHHKRGLLYSITAMCQACHANSVLNVH